MLIAQPVKASPADPSAKRTDVSRYRTSEIDLERLVARHVPRDPDQSDPQPNLRQIAVGGLAPWQMRNVQTYVDMYLRSTIRVEALAGLCNLSSGHFQRAFKASLGETPHKYVTRRRMEMACRMMTGTDEPLCRIALECGMTDQAHLTNSFRRLYGIAPNAWRKRMLLERSGHGVRETAVARRN
ncbi:helix-turn-helix domain-containing protein [Neorhizobium galegae]|uniref:helix-turn-helix domain-containing protein n=2 Tax=Neorhizobium galegae TaxID=399 RepID=UPI000621F914|nr:AraC family transcriptional regulator [Neorhizobium galegae]CDZ28362.1 Transcriptional regulator, AraC family [Neorhizobium galegae bv. officinalis]KAA9388135.1 helix-turn-helix transcriptional regulator [Neorhizobium galegae]KAB1115405.1 helix-turn-helix transcriptional regulator [Neorhizobium galegae]MCM2498408.1 AraC family transcriptional regulator [Neorhizobium galegae]MCQ1773321.1 AraC family transcriptional regulator [Neorhizobium galegae]